jgi:hypothetical protein
MAENYLPGTNEDGTDYDQNARIPRFLANLFQRQEAVWGAVCQGRIVVDWRQLDFDTVEPSRFVMYLPASLCEWWSQHADQCIETIHRSMCSTWPTLRMSEAVTALEIEFQMDVPDELKDFVAKNLDRPKPRRYNSTAVTYLERDGVAWLTPPEARLYDALKESHWLFTPQPQFLAGEEIDRRPDFCVYWNGRAQWAVLVEVDSDAFHKPSQRDDDEAKKRLFESRGFQYLRFSAKMVLDNPSRVLSEIAEFCERKYGR